MEKIELDVRTIIDRVKNEVGCKTDKELSYSITGSQGTVTNWINRNSINFDVLIRYLIINGIDLNIFNTFQGNSFFTFSSTFSLENNDNLFELINYVGVSDIHEALVPIVLQKIFKNTLTQLEDKLYSSSIRDGRTIKITYELVRKIFHSINQYQKINKDILFLSQITLMSEIAEIISSIKHEEEKLKFNENVIKKLSASIFNILVDNFRLDFISSHFCEAWSVNYDLISDNINKLTDFNTVYDLTPITSLGSD